MTLTLLPTLLAPRALSDPGPASVRYRYLLTDLLTGKVLSEGRALTVSSYARRLSTTGEASVTLDVSTDATRGASDPVAATEPRRTALWVIRNEQLVWGGIIWTRRYQSADVRFDLGVTSFESYYSRRRIRSTLNYPQVDQHQIVWDLLRRAALLPFGDIGVKVGAAAPPPSGVKRDRLYLWHERATYLERVQQLSDVIGGPDFTLEPSWDTDGSPAVWLRVGTPLGSPSGVEIVEYPGDVRNYSWPDDGGSSANYWSAIGATAAGDNDGPPLIRDASMSAEWAAGVPLLEDVSTHDGVTDVSTLSGYAIANVRAAAGNRVVPEITLRLPPTAGALPGLGDTLQVRITDPARFPPDPVDGSPGLIASARVIGWTVNVSQGEGETISLELGQV